MKQNIDLLSFLSEEPITAKELSKLTGIAAPYIREKINDLRSKCYPVIATKNGYYITNDPADIDKQIKSFLKRITVMKKAIDGLLIAKTTLERKQMEKRMKYER